MSVREEFDAWAAEGRDRGMEDRHWHTAKHALSRMPVEAGDTVLDLGCGSGHVSRRRNSALANFLRHTPPCSPRIAGEYTTEPLYAKTTSRV